MSYRVVDPSTLPVEPGPHPAASPFDKRISQRLGVSAFEVYQVELPPGAQTVRHDHRADGVEDLYVILSGTGWMAVDDEHIPVRPGLFIAVTVESNRQLLAGSDGLVFVAMCAEPR